MKNTILPKSSDFELATYTNIGEPDNKRDQNYSPLFDASMEAIHRNIQTYVATEDFNNFWSSSLFPERLSKNFLRLTEEYTQKEIERNTGSLVDALNQILAITKQSRTNDVGMLAIENIIKQTINIK